MLFRSLREKAGSDLYIEPHIWSGIGLARSGCGSAIVGDPDQVLAKLNAYRALGMEAFILSGYPRQAHQAILQRLTELGCEVTDHSVSTVLGYGSVTFKGSPEVIARLALIFAAPAQAQSLVITAKVTLGRRQGGRSVLQAVV